MALAALTAAHAVRGRIPVLLAVAGVVALLGLGVLGVLAPLRARQVQRAVERDEGVTAPRLVLVATGVVVLAGCAALLGVLSPR
nr:hypothetical protein [Geodermatophilus sabuli]